MNRIILDLCGGSGSWSKPYSDAGYDVRLITIPENDVRDYNPPYNVYGILAAPPCTEFSLARNGINRYMDSAPVRDIDAGLEIVNACLRIIDQCDPKFYAIENPVGLLSNYLGKPDFTFQPWEFGDLWTKRTALWGTFNHPIKTFKTKDECLAQIDIPIKEYYKNRKISAPIRKGALLPSRADMDRTHFKFAMKEERSAFRAITAPGFARAFFNANK